MSNDKERDALMALVDAYAEARTLADATPTTPKPPKLAQRLSPLSHQVRGVSHG